MLEITFWYGDSNKIGLMVMGLSDGVMGLSDGVMGLSDGDGSV